MGHPVFEHDIVSGIALEVVGQLEAEVDIMLDMLLQHGLKEYALFAVLFDELEVDIIKVLPLIHHKNCLCEDIRFCLFSLCFIQHIA